jgi:aspartyl/glutamyl-tRNA(Asn/Gln) amidotransferase C subunit
MKHYRVNKLTGPGGAVIKKKDVVAPNDRQAVKDAADSDDCRSARSTVTGQKVGSITLSLSPATGPLARRKARRYRARHVRKRRSGAPCRQARAHRHERCRGREDGARIQQYPDWVEQLGEVDTDGVEPLTAVIDNQLRLRDDVVNDGDCPRRRAENAPDAQHGFFAVPKVIE